MENDKEKELEPPEEVQEKQDERTKATPELLPPEDLLEDLSISTSVADFSLKKISECQQQSNEQPVEVNNIGEKSCLVTAHTDKEASNKTSAAQSAEKVSIGSRSSSSPTTPRPMASSFGNRPPTVTALYSQDTRHNDLLVEDVEAANVGEEKELNQQTHTMERQESKGLPNSSGEPDEKLFAKRNNKEDLPTLSANPTDSQNDKAKGGNINAVLPDDDKDHLDIIAENTMDLEDVDEEDIVPEDIKEEEKKEGGQKRKQQSAMKRKDGVKKTVKTAPGKLANIIATKSPAQQRSIVAGVTKRLAQRQSSLSLLPNGKQDAKVGGIEKKQPNKLSNQKSQASLASKATLEDEKKLPTFANNYKPLPSIGSSDANGKISKLKEKKTQSKQDLEVTKRSSEKVLDKSKKSTAGVMTAAMKNKNTGIEKVLNSTKLKQAKLDKEKNGQVPLENEVDKPAGVEIKVEGETTEAQPASKQDHLVTPAMDSTSTRKESLLSTDSSYFIRMNQAQQESEATKKAEKKKEVLPVKLMSNDGSLLKSLIPYLPMPVAILCLVFNILLPGVGTIVSGLSVLCCGRPRVDGKDDQIPKTVILNFFVGIFQMTTITFMLVGWFWSIFWGIYMVILSKSQNSNGGARDDVESTVILL